jgi:hypothetical protein
MLLSQSGNRCRWSPIVYILNFFRSSSRNCFRRVRKSYNSLLQNTSATRPELLYMWCSKIPSSSYCRSSGPIRYVVGGFFRSVFVDDGIFRHQHSKDRARVMLGILNSVFLYSGILYFLGIVYRKVSQMMVELYKNKHKLLSAWIKIRCNELVSVDVGLAHE